MAPDNTNNTSPTSQKGNEVNRPKIKLEYSEYPDAPGYGGPFGRDSLNSSDEYPAGRYS